MELSSSIDIFFYGRVTQDILEELQNGLDFPVVFSGWKIVEYKNGDMVYFVTIDTQPEKAERVIKTLWDNLKTPFIAYEGRRMDYHNCVRWFVDMNGIKCVKIIAD
ncbi:MAG: hypothetical protein PHW13_03270 [Methylococcales bacterium]|nr:hypothetical protein [Methylococcales bacterium]